MRTRSSISPEHSVSLKACFGIAEKPFGGLVVEEFLNDAALALSAAKSAGQCGYRVFGPELRIAFEQSSRVAQELIQAMKDDHIEVWLQPQIELETCSIVGAEALVRWVDPKDGVHSPAAFLPVAEEAGLMEELDAIARRKGLEAISRINRETGLDLSLGLNMTAQFLSSENCVELLLSELAAANLCPSQIDIEILETVMIDETNASAVKDNITRLSKHGFHIDLDDFGTGHASISSLRDLHVDRVKIDRSFIVDIHENQNLQTFTNALIQLSKSLGIRVLAEGIEREEEVQWLARHGCEYIQGYLISKPVPEEKLLQLLSVESSELAA